MTSGKPTREQADLAEVLEMVLDKGIVINADIAVTVGQTEMIGIELRAAIASFETAAQYGLAFPSGTDMRRVEAASDREPLEGDEAEAVEGDAREAIDLGIGASSGGETTQQSSRATPGRRPNPAAMIGDEDDQPNSEESEAAAADRETDSDEDESGADDRSDDTDDTDGEDE